MNPGKFVSLKGMNKRNTEEPKAKPWGKAVFVGTIVLFIVGSSVDVAFYSDIPSSVPLVFGIIIGLIVMFIVLHGGRKNAAIQVKNAAIQVTAAAKRTSRAAEDIIKEADKKVGGEKEIETEEDAYERAAEEIENKSQNKGMWAKAFADADGDEQKQKALYLKYRAKQLSDQSEQ